MKDNGTTKDGQFICQFCDKDAQSAFCNGKEIVHFCLFHQGDAIVYLQDKNED